MIRELDSGSRVSSLDGLRGIAVLIVFFSHTSGRGMPLSDQLNFHGIGHIGVYLFFVLSSFLLTLQLLKKDLSFKNLTKFYIKRFLRIIPLYYVIVIGVFFIEQYTGGINEKYLNIGGTRSLMLHFSFYQGNSVFWSIVIEMQFYLIVPLIIYLLKQIPKLTIFGLSSLAFLNFILYTSKLISWPSQNEYIELITTNAHGKGGYLDVFICGILAAYFYEKYSAMLNRWNKEIGWGSFFLFALLLFVSVVVISKNFLGIEEVYRDLRYFSIVYGFIFSLFLVSLMLGSPVQRLFSWKPIRFIGIIGFSFYLLHMAIFQCINLTEINPTLKFILAFLFTSLISLISFLSIERGSINLAKKINAYIK